jgi:hypothetical protein
MKSALIILTAACSVLPWCAALADKPDGVAVGFAADKFYRTYLKLDPRGLPTYDQMKQFAPLFTAELNATIEDARRHREKLQRENPTAGPLWREGNLFASLRQGISFYGIGLPVILGDTATVPMQLEYHYQGQITRWIDVMVLERSGRYWLVDDIFFNAPWAMMSGASLRSRLWLPMNQVALSEDKEKAAEKPAPVAPSPAAKPTETKKPISKKPPAKVILPKILETI